LKEFIQKAVWEFRRRIALVRKWSIWFQEVALACHLSSLADAEPDAEKAVRLHNEAIFWLLVEVALEPLHYVDRRSIDWENGQLCRRLQLAKREC
jgi:hypothetical protein